MVVEFSTTILPILCAGIWALIGFTNSWLGPDHSPDWSKMAITFCIGIGVALVASFSNIEISYEYMLAQIGLYIGSVATIDKFVHMALKIKEGGLSSA